MAQTVRITDEFYELIQATSTLTHRSLTQQLEHWARLGARVELGLTTAQTLALLGESSDAAEILERIKSLGAEDPSSEIAMRHAKHEAEVAAGSRDAASLLVIPKKAVKSAKLTYAKKPFGRARSW